MEFIEQFRLFLLQKEEKPNKITVKNYLADVRKFIRWFETKFARQFTPRLVTKEIVSEFKSNLSSHDSQSQVASANSLKRYLSSLRKFYQFLLEKNLVSLNPFELNSNEASATTDIWHLKEFKNYLFISKASKPTIKNYMMDLRQFITWFTEVTAAYRASQSPQTPLLSIDSTTIEEYKNRLLYDARFGPRSINRKLSSLRKYFSWAQSSGIINNSPQFTQVKGKATQGEPMVQESSLNYLPEEVAAPILATQPQTASTYSRFPPLRLLQKLSRGGSLVFDLLILNPVVGSIMAVKYQFWKLTGRQVFGSATTLGASVSEAGSWLISNQVSQSIGVATAPLASFEAFVTGNSKVITGVGNLPKSLYAPLSISTADFTLGKKLLHHARHTRPKWYKRYHSFPVVHYLHFGVALIYACALGFMIYQAVVQSPHFQAPVMASLPGSPPRMLAFEGTLTDASSTPITAEQTLRFGLYDNPTASGSALLWEESQQVQPDNNGNFETLLGKNRPIYQSLLTDNPRLYIGITIGAEAELAPRQQIATIAYSQDSERLQGLAPITQPDAGTENVILALDSAGDLIVGGSASPRFEATGGEFTIAGQTLTLTTSEGSNGNIQIAPDGVGIVDIQKPIQNTTDYNNIIGVQGAVEFDDSVAILATTSAQSAFYINQNSTGDLISASSSGLAKFTVNYLGRGTFASDLAVNGNNLTTDSPTFNLLNKNVVNLNFAGSASNISIGSSSGQTAINNRLVANNGLYLPTGKDLMLEGFTKGAIPFVGTNKEVKQDVENFVWADDTKRLGLGTNAPLYRLDVRETQPTDSVAQIYNTDTGTNADGLRIKLGAATPSTNNNFISFVNGSDTVLGKITGNGGSNVIYNTSGADYAEYYKKAYAFENFEQGDIVCLTKTSGVTKCSPGETILGVVSKTAGFVGAGNHDNDPSYVLVGIVGQLPAKVASGSASIATGDPLTIGTKGVTKATKPGMIIGHALQEYNPGTDHMVSVALNVGWYDPNIAINQEGDVLPDAQLQATSPSLFDGIIDNIQLGLTEATGLSTQSLSVATENVSVGGVILRDYVGAIVKETTRELENQIFTRKLVSPIAEIAHVKTNVISPLSDDANIALQFDDSQIQVINPKISSTSAVATIDNEGNASFSGTLRARRIIADEIHLSDEALAKLEGSGTNNASNSSNYITNVTNIYNYASTSAETQNTEATQLAENTVPTNGSELLGTADIATDMPVGTFNTDFPMFDNGLVALAGSSFTDVGISGTLRVGDNMRFSDTSINTFGTELALQPLRQGNLSIMGGLVMIDTDGNAIFNKDVTVKGRFAASVIVPVPDQDLLMQLPKESKFEIQTGTGSAALTVNQYGDVVASGSGSFGNVAAKAFTIIRGVQADSSLTTTIAEGSGGTAVITANERERTIFTPYMRPNSLIYVTPTSQTYGVTPYIARQTENSFTIQIPYPITRDIKLNWWIVN